MSTRFPIPDTPPNLPQSSNKQWLIIGTIVFIIVVALGIFFSSRGGDDPTLEDTETPTIVAEKLTVTQVSTNIPTDIPPPIATKTPTIEPTKTAVPPTSTTVPSVTPTLTPMPPTETPSIRGLVTANVNLYPEPNDEGERITYIPTDSEVTVLGRPPHGRWILLQTDDNIGYSSADFIKLPPGMELEDLPIVDIVIPVPTSTPPPSAADGWPTPSSWDAEGTAVSVQSASIRPAPNNSVDSADFPFVDVDDVVDVLGRNATSSWLYIRDKDENEGFVWGEYFEYPNEISQLPIITSSSTHDTDEASTTTPQSPSSDIAYWQEVESSKRQIEDGRWVVDLLVHVPEGESYSFSEDGDLDINYLHDGNSHHSGYIKYIVTISGMSCQGPLNRDLHVLQDGHVMEIHNEFTNTSGAMYIDPPGC